MDDRHALARFVDAQRDTFAEALAELKAGDKRSHWMWFVFPQIEGLGRSPTARHFAIVSIEEARHYLAHPLLGSRLRDAVAALAALPSGMTAEEVLGPIDAIKLRSSLTLFAAADPGDPVFEVAIDRWFGGERDDATLRLIDAS